MRRFSSWLPVHWEVSLALLDFVLANHAAVFAAGRLVMLNSRVLLQSRENQPGGDESLKWIRYDAPTELSRAN